MRFNPKRLPFTSRALFTIVGGAVLINPAFAQDQSSEELDEVVVTGIRGSLKASMNMKREATGVVDAINAEDIGKFPDTNLAESLHEHRLTARVLRVVNVTELEEHLQLHELLLYGRVVDELLLDHSLDLA